MSEPVKEWNPRYLAYAAAHGRDPDAMLAHDVVRWPGGKMVGFICWIHRGITAWRASRKIHREEPLSPQDHADFTAWLEQHGQTIVEDT